MQHRGQGVPDHSALPVGGAQHFGAFCDCFCCFCCFPICTVCKHEQNVGKGSFYRCSSTYTRHFQAYGKISVPRSL